MKLALIYDACQQKSFYVKNGVAYDYENKNPYSHVHSVSPSLHMAGWNFPFLWDDSAFLNLSEWVNQGKEFPDGDFDVILYAKEKPGLDSNTYDLYRTERLQDRYPNAKIFAWFKEIHIPRSTKEREENRIKWLNGFGNNIMSHGLSCMKDLPVIRDIENKLERKIEHYISCPINIDGLFDNFYSNEKELSIFSYTVNGIERRVQTLEFSKYLGKKYNIPVRIKPLELNQEYAYLTQKEFIELWSPSLFHVNLDPHITQPGQQAIQVACVGSLNIGGMNESHQHLFPKTSSSDLQVVEEKFKEYLMDEVARFKAIEYAWNKVNELYSFDVLRKQLLDVVDKYDG
jgi:hypothetical protein